MTETSSECDSIAVSSLKRICSRCIYDERVASISFDAEGVCNYCRQIDELALEYGTGSSRGEKQLALIVDKIQRAGHGKRYDCVVGVSGGTDSMYLVYLAKKWGLRPLAVHYDNTWNSAVATQNISKVLRALDVDLFTHVVDNKESDDIFRSFFYAGVAEIEAPTDLGLAETLYRVAAKYRLQYILEGHSFLTEGITPVGRNYFDGKYIKSIHRKFGNRPMKSYPLMTFWRFIWATCFLRVKKIRPFWYISYSKEDARAFLEHEFGWTYYGGHHLENRMTAFFHGVYAPRKFNTDFRNNTLSALVRLGKMSRESALNEYNSSPLIDPDLLNYFRKRLDISQNEYDRIMNEAPRSWADFPTYKKRFELLRPFFLILAKANLVPMSFYLKYCFPAKSST
jgi:N-acetyl sugar amidotransferase